MKFWSNIEKFHIFRTNKRILLFALNEKIVTLDQKILNCFFEDELIKQNYYLYFYPEIKEMIRNNLIFEEKTKMILNDNIDFFLEKRKIGENDSLLCNLIRNDRIEDFSAYIKKESIPLSSKIIQSIFETNPFLLENNPTLIEYSAFFGSINIFKYLMRKGVELTPSVWLFGIHGRNYEIIEIIEKYGVEPINNSYISCFIESIKCHYHEITELLFKKYIQNSITNMEKFQIIFNKHCLKFYNFTCINKEFVQHPMRNFIDYINNEHQELPKENDIIDDINSEKCIIGKNVFSNLMSELFKNIDMSYETYHKQEKIIENLNEKVKNLQNENFDLMNSIKSLRLQKSLLIQRINKAKNYNKLIIGKLKKKNSKIKELNEHIQILSKIENNSSNEIEYGPENLTPSLILEILKNSKINVFCRKYSRALKDICFMLYINSNITYKLLRKFIPLPNPDNLRKEYSVIVKNKQDNLLNKDQIEYLLEELRGEMSKKENEPIVATIAFDAATIDPRNQGLNGIFVFNYQPLDGSKPTKVINLETRDNGRADQGIIDRAKEIEELAKDYNIIFRFVASDSDSKTNPLHTDFQNYIKDFEGDNFDALIEYIHNYQDMIPISDWLHLCKNLRTRLANSKIILFKGAKEINSQKIQEILQIDLKVFTAAGRESMRDDLAMKLINFDSLNKFAENDEYSCLVLLLPFVLFTDVLQSTNLSIYARKQLCFISYEIISLLYNESKGIQNIKSKNTDKVGYLRNSMRERTQNTILGFAYALEFYGKKLMTSRLGTHIVEFIFGHMRNGCNGYDVLDRCVYQLVKSEITKEMLEKYNKEELPIAGRSHPGGACFSDQWNIDIDNDIDIQKVANECIELIHGNLNYQNSNIQKLIQFLSKEAPTKVPKLRETISCAKIQARQIHYSKKH